MLEQAAWAARLAERRTRRAPRRRAARVAGPRPGRSPGRRVSLRSTLSCSRPSRDSCVYAGAKGVYGAATFEPRIVERNLIYLAPLAWVALVTLLRYRTVSLLGLRGAAAATAYAMAVTPFPLTIRSTAMRPDPRAVAPPRPFRLGAGRDRRSARGDARAVGARPRVAAARASPVASRSSPPRSLLRALTWGVWAEIQASDESNEFSRSFEAGLPTPRDWVDRATGGEPVVYLGQKIADPNGIWSLEFWNPSVERVWSLDGSAPGPGPTLTPDLARHDGRSRATRASVRDRRLRCGARGRHRRDEGAARALPAHRRAAGSSSRRVASSRTAGWEARTRRRGEGRVQPVLRGRRPSPGPPSSPSVARRGAARHDVPLAC